MKTIHIDFAPRSISRSMRRMRATYGALLGVALVLCVGATTIAIDLVWKNEALQTELRQIQDRIEDKEASKPVPKKFTIPDTEAAAVNGAIAQLNLPWRDVFDAVEAATPTTIALLAIEPDARKHLLRGMAEAQSSDGMIAYIEGLKKQPFFNSVVLTRHEINEQDPNKPIRFQYEASWAGAQK